ncbi:MAG: hypothetical protein HY298_18485 [Verrucomicrobia bacterium]|nr:hypothetical protein [Verrucomicrobiota bacterium]
MSNHLSQKMGFVLCTALLGALTGCTTYVDQPGSRGAYYQEPPRPREVYAPPPAAYVPPPPAYVPPPAVEVDASVGFGIRAESDFYEPLTPYGRWEVVGSYGRCWIPGRVEVNWRPYCNGNWQRTDAGWYWASDEPWAWATYHYGRWDFSAQFGWYWVPQTQWAPAWVSWHEGGGYVGWAPLQPSARISFSGSVEVNVGLVAPRAFVFVEQRRFLEPVRPTTVVVNNNTVINKTVNITKIKVINKTVINEGPRTEVVEQASGRKVQSVPVRELRRNQEAEVVARHQKAPPGREKQEGKLQNQDRGVAEPREQKAAPIREQRSVQKPAVAPNQPVAPAAGRQVREIDNQNQNRATKLAQEEEKRVRNENERVTQQQNRDTRSAQDAEKRAREEQARATKNEQSKAARSVAEARSVANPPTATKESIEPKTERKVQQQTEKQVKRAEEVKRGAQRQTELRAKREQVASEEARKKAAKKDRKKKVEDPQAFPENPAVSPQSSP